MSELRQRVSKPKIESFTNDIELGLTGKDFVNVSRSSNGQQFIELSLDPINVNQLQSMIKFKKPLKIPMYAEYEASISQRVKGTYFITELTDVEAVVDSPNEYTIVSITQSTTTLTVVIDAAFDGWLGSWVDIYGLADSRFNYPNASINSISIDRKTLTIKYSDDLVIPSLNATPVSVTGGLLKRQAKLQGAGNAAGARYNSTSTGVMSPMVRFNNGGIKGLGTLVGSQYITCGSTAPSFVSGATGDVEIKATTRFKIELDGENVAYLDGGVDTIGLESTRGIITTVRPDSKKDYYFRIRGNSSISFTSPVARVKSISKSGSAVATVVTDVPHGLTTTSQITIYGVRDVANFAPTLATVASIISPTSFTVSYGTSATVTSYGGFISLIYGGNAQAGLTVGTVTTATRDNNGLVTLVNTSTWSGIGGVGEYVNLHGCLDSTGTDLGLDGAYRVNNFTTTSLILEPIKNVDLSYVTDGEGNNVTPNGIALPTTNCGGYVLLRSTFRLHDQTVTMYTQEVTKIAGQGTNRSDLAMPVTPVGSFTITEGAVISPSVYTLTTLATTNASSVKTSAGNLYSIVATNLTATTMYLKIYNKASAPTVGTDIPIMTIPLPANDIKVLEFGRVGIRPSLGIALAVTGGLADSDTTVITAGNKLIVSYI